MQSRNRLRQAHSNYVLSNAGMIRFATALYDGGGNQKGSVYIFEAPDPETVWQWFAGEPFYRGNVYKDFRVEDISPAFNNLPNIQWPID
jgi:uncharacterized protein YciI